MKKKILYGLGGVIVLVGGLLWFSSSPVSLEQAKATLEQKVQTLQQKSPQLAQAQMMVFAPNKNLSAQFGATQSQPFHVASMGKLFTTILIAQLVETQKLDWNSKISEILPEESLQGLFVIKGIDYKKDVTLEQLLMHTSGIADYFADPVNNGSPVMEQLSLEPQKIWTPKALLAVSRDQQQAVAAPGQKFHYSDSGFILLGLIIEAIYQQPFETVVHQRIFEPLGMQHSYFPFRTQPKTVTAQLSPVWVNGTDLSQAKALTADWSGGGVASTSTDLLAFAQALLQHKLVKAATLEYLSQSLNRFEQVIGYGRGMMRLKFGDFFPLLAGYPDMVGHMGILGTQVMVDPKNKTIVIISLGSTGYMEDSVRLLIDVIGIIQRIQN